MSYSNLSLKIFCFFIRFLFCIFLVNLLIHACLINRGRKWNPLRQRLDSYDYTVEQHVVGSLLFTPVLLLLPTASIFYIFFSILSSTIICLCIVLEISVSIIHCTPYAALILWVTRRQRFPVGLLFLPVDDALPVEYCSTSGSGEKKTDEHIHVHSVPLVSELNCNYNTLGKVLLFNFVYTFLILMPHLSICVVLL
jgi:phosphatidylinositol glycan class Q protein